MNTKGVRCTVLCEDKRTERFFRHLLDALGFEKRKLTFRTAPSSKGAAEAWVRAAYPLEVGAVRARSRENICLLTVRDGDRFGVSHRKNELDNALSEHGMPRRQPDEQIANPVPTWSIETWLLQLLGAKGLSEANSHKAQFDSDFCWDEKAALRSAAEAWVARKSESELPSLQDGRQEIERLC